MENAAKALLIAGEVLIGIIILGILSLVFRKALLVRESYQERIDQQAVTTFNVEFQKYLTNDTKKLYSEDVVSLINRVCDWNSDEGHDIIKLEVNLLNGAKIIVERSINSVGTALTFSEKNFLTKYKLEDNNNTVPPSEYKFKCEMTYNGENGKVDTITVTRLDG